MAAPGTAGGNGFVWLYMALAAALVTAASLLLPGRKEAARLAAAGE